MIAFLRFELRYWLRGLMVWVFLLIIGAMFFGAASSDQIVVGQALQNTYRNAPHVIQNFYAIACLLTLLMATAFVNSAAARDFQYNTHQILFATPIRKRDYLTGRFLGSSFAAVIPMLGVSIALILARYMPWVDPDRWRSIHWMAHLNAILCFAIPNTLFIAAIIFTIAVLTRSTVTSFLGSLLLMVAYGISQALIGRLENETLGMLLDPFGIRTFAILTKYWTVAEKNNQSLALTGMLLLNRLIWLGVGAAVFAFGYVRFRFEERSCTGRNWFRRRKPAVADAPDAPATSPAAVAIPHASREYAAASQFTRFLGQTRVEFAAMVKSTVFIVILAMAFLNCIPALFLNVRQLYGTPSFPVTYQVLDTLRGTLYLFLVGIIVYFGGVLVWRERDARYDEIHDATPHANWIGYASKFCSLMSAGVLVLAVAALAGIFVQTWYHYSRYQVDLYLKELFVFDLAQFAYLAFLAFLVHVLTPNKYIGYFAFIVVLLVSAFIWRPLNIGTLMVQFGETPRYIYSDFYRYAPFLPGMLWFNLYWLLFCLILAAGATLLWPRGKDTAIRLRWRNASLNFAGPARLITIGLCLTWAATAGWVYYNTKVLNHFYTSKDRERAQAGYEKTYKKYQGLNQPRIQNVKYWIDLFPHRRNMTMRAEQTILNKGTEPIAELHLNFAPFLKTEIDIPTATLAQTDDRLLYRIYTLSPPLAPGATLPMKFTVTQTTVGFENQVTGEEITQNGSFFNNTIAPQIGYQPSRELGDKNERKKHGLPEKDRMPALERNCTARCANTYLSNNSDWVDVETVISTSEDQIAIAPGSLLKEWRENGRRYAQYKLDRASLNFYSFLSARYEVAREEWNGIKTEVYYHNEHKWNVPKMMSSIKKTLDYCTRNFGAYAHKQARIIEFPRVATFAQAFPGTMPYSEGIGFIANLNDTDDIDYVYYVVAHELGHQWWAHQIIGANMQGATLLSESLAQYTALMVMEKEYGRDMMRKFLKHEMDRYLRARGREQLKERPLLTVEGSQGYTHYNKGSVVLYYLREMIGEEAVNRVLRDLIEKWAYIGPPYPTSYELVDRLRAATPPGLQYLIKDLFEEMTLFSNRTLEAKSRKRPDGVYEVTVVVESHKFKADEKGDEKEVSINDWVEIGAFAKPPKGSEYGATLHRQRVRITQPKNTFTFAVKELPDRAGIDPFALLIDRIPNDNLKKVTNGQ
ncbi:MAG: ABC transporter permease subunit [Acidobacteria bacterium]|nr:ABC transporter permease subunit [Acidobacteriota bacterium]